MKDDFATGCTFCNFDEERNTIFWQDKNVRVWDTPDEFKRDYLEHQFIIAPKEHLRFPWDMSPAKNDSLLKAQQKLQRKHNFLGGMLFVRFGAMHLNSGTVPHIHWNLWVPKGTQSVRIPLFKDPELTAKNEERLKRFEFLAQQIISVEKFNRLVSKGIFDTDGNILG